MTGLMFPLREPCIRCRGRRTETIFDAVTGGGHPHPCCACQPDQARALRGTCQGCAASQGSWERLRPRRDDAMRLAREVVLAPSDAERFTRLLELVHRDHVGGSWSCTTRTCSLCAILAIAYAPTDECVRELVAIEGAPVDPAVREYAKAEGLLPPRTEDGR